MKTISNDRLRVGISAVLFGATLALVQIAWGGNIQGNGRVAENLKQNILLDRAQMEVLATANAQPEIIRRLQNYGIDTAKLASVPLVAPATPLANDPVANRKLVANQMSKNFALSQDDTTAFTNLAGTGTLQSTFMTGDDIFQIYKPVPNGQAIQVGGPTIAGQLCNLDNAQVIVDPRNQVIHIVSASLVWSDGDKLVDRKACTLALPIVKPKGRALTVQNIDVHGVVAKQGQVQAAINFEVFAAGSQNPSVSQALVPANAPNVFAQRFIAHGGPAFILAPGLNSTILRLNLSLNSTSQNPASQGIIALDRISIRYSLK